MQREAEPQERALGAYGLRLGGVEAGHLLVSAHPAWPLVEVSVTIAPSMQILENVTDELAVLGLRSGGRILLERTPATAEFVVPEPLSAEELVHPYLAPVGAMMAYWLDRESFHAGGLAVSEDVWGVIGDRFAGKSTLLAWLALAGHAIVADDLLVIDRASAGVFAGPRSVDLRQDAAERLDAGEGLGVVGARERWRLRLRPIAGPLTLRGWIFLAWGEEIELRPVSAAARVTLLAGQRGIRLPPRSPTALLELAALPCLELRRPRDWESLGRAAELLLSALESGGTG